MSSEYVLPQQLKDLQFLAGNLRWSWDSSTRALFEQLDPALWSATKHNPCLLLKRIDPISLQIAAQNENFVTAVQHAADDLRRYLSEDRWYQHEHGQTDIRIAYFSAEFAITEALPIFSGGLGVLAGDHLKSASDLGVPLIAVTLLYREGYFDQRVDREGRQFELYDPADPHNLPISEVLNENGEPLIVNVPMLDHQAHARVWRADVGRVPLYLLDTDIEQNGSSNRRITDRLYGGDNEHRLRQEIVLGIGGVRALNALGMTPDVIHLNEGHAAFAAVEHVRESIKAYENGAFFEASRKLTQHCVFTTHTPVPAGHDMFAANLLERYLGGYVWEMREPWRRFLALGRHDPTDDDEPFNMTLLALRMSGRRNGVSKLHGEVSRRMWYGVWPGIAVEDVPIKSITNGVHLPTWQHPAVKQWSSEYQNVADIPNAQIWAARNELRGHMIQYVRQVLARQLSRRGGDASRAKGLLHEDALTIVFARRFATYKRATLLLSDADRLLNILRNNNVQFLFAGKAHPKDEPGKELLRQIWEFGWKHDVADKFMFVEEYDVALARYLTSGADVWLNVPRKPYEASGTSGMKSAANGGLNLSIPDGWWAEAWVEHNNLPAQIGWSIEGASVAGGQDRADAEALYSLLETSVIAEFFDRDQNGVPNRWCERIKASMQQVVPYFNTDRMVREYVDEAYIPAYKSST